MPELSVIAYAGGEKLPLGWQLCDGLSLKYYNNISKTSLNEVFTNDQNPIFSNLKIIPGKQNTYGTPDLKGRFILGSNSKIIDENTPNVRSVRKVNDFGGEERVVLKEGQMPKHTHDDRWVMRPTPEWDANTIHKFKYGYGTANAIYGSINETKGNNESHENMPPFYVLTYIIKQPIKV